MPFLIILVGITLALVAYNDTQDQLATNLEQDLPGFFKWGAAVLAIAGLGFIPGFQRFSRMLLALVIVVIVLKNYSQIISSFENLASSVPSESAVSKTTPTTPSAAYSASVSPLAGFSGAASSGGGFGAALGSGSGDLLSGIEAGALALGGLF
jgi:hypothetical protein